MENIMEDTPYNYLRKYYEKIGCLYAEQGIGCDITCQIFEGCKGNLEEKINEINKGGLGYFMEKEKERTTKKR
jgi:hypothetical protein